MPLEFPYQLCDEAGQPLATVRLVGRQSLSDLRGVLVYERATDFIHHWGFVRVELPDRHATYLIGKGWGLLHNVITSPIRVWDEKLEWRENTGASARPNWQGIVQTFSGSHYILNGPPHVDSMIRLDKEMEDLLLIHLKKMQEQA